MPERPVVVADLQVGRRRRPRLLGIIAAVAMAGGFGVALGAQRGLEPRSILILGGTLIDGSDQPPRRNEGILVVGGRIKAMGLDAVRHAPKDARVIEAADQWIVPGLVDGHVHFFQTGGLDARPDFMPVPRGRPYTAIVDAIRRRPQPYLRAYVCAGVTSVADVGGPMWGFDLRESRLDDPLSPRIAFRRGGRDHRGHRRRQHGHVARLVAAPRVAADGGIRAVDAPGSARIHPERRTLDGSRARTGAHRDGYLADILVLDGDPLADIRHLRKPAVIIRGGAVYNP